MMYDLAEAIFLFATVSVFGVLTPAQKRWLTNFRQTPRSIACSLSCNFWKA